MNLAAAVIMTLGRPEKVPCFQRVASGPTWENRFCAIPKLKGSRYCWLHDPDRRRARASKRRELKRSEELRRLREGASG